MMNRPHNDFLTRQTFRNWSRHTFRNSHLHQSITQLRNALDQLIANLVTHKLQALSAAELQIELTNFKAQQHQQQKFLQQIDQNPLLGYLDTTFLTEDAILQIQPLFSNPHQSVQISAQHLNNKDGKPILKLIDSCQSEKYQTYRRRKQNGFSLRQFTEYTITQKLYPNRPSFIGQAPKAVFPRLECLWGDADEPTMQPNPLTQVWCIYPMIRTDPPQWIVIAATTDQHPLKIIVLENGEIAQEGTYEYLVRSLGLMAQCEDEYTHSLAGLVNEAVELKRVKYLHIHQTLNPRTEEPRDIINMQFQLFR